MTFAVIKYCITHSAAMYITADMSVLILRYQIIAQVLCQTIYHIGQAFYNLIDPIRRYDNHQDQAACLDTILWLQVDM